MAAQMLSLCKKATAHTVTTAFDSIRAMMKLYLYFPQHICASNQGCTRAHGGLAGLVSHPKGVHL